MTLKSGTTTVASTPCKRRRTRAGFGVIEVIVALLLFAMAMMGMAGMLVQAAQAATEMETRTGRAATQTKALNRLATLPYASLPAEVGCETVTTRPFPHVSCVAVTDVPGGTGSRLVRLIIRPTDGRLRADTAWLTRSVGAPVNPLNQ